MANLKEIRTRISSVKTTRQVTNAMKMISAVRLKKAQDDISHVRPYATRLASIIKDLVGSLNGKYSIPFSQKGKGETTLILIMASNRGLCGGFNINVVKRLKELLNDKYKREWAEGKVTLAVMGKQVEKMFGSHGLKADYTYHNLLNSINYDDISSLADSFMSGFKSGQFKEVVIVYNEFVNATMQKVQIQQYLPLTIPMPEPDDYLLDYLLEPDPTTIISTLIPKMLQSMLFQVVLESAASEHGARMTSMHKATDNATELIRDLQLKYNKTRQLAITNQIVEITGGAEALKKM